MRVTHLGNRAKCGFSSGIAVNSMAPRGRERSASWILRAPLNLSCPCFGRALRFLRSAAGLTQDELSERSGVHTTEISRLEKGEGNPTLKTVKRLAKGLGCPCSHLFALEEVFEREGEST